MSTSTKRMWNLLTVLGLLLVFILVPAMRYYGSSDKPEDRVFINYGLDLKGGVDLVLEVDRTQYTGVVQPEQMEGAIEVMRRKIDPGGVKEIVVQQVGDERIAVQVPGAKDHDAVKAMIGRPDLLKWVHVIGDKPIPARTLVRFIDDVSILEAEEEAAAAEDASDSMESETDESSIMDALAPPGETAEPETVSEETEAVESAETEIITGTLQETEEGKYELTPVDDTGAPIEDEGTTKDGEEEWVNIIIDPSSERNQLVITGEDLEWVQTTFYNNQPVISFKVERDAARKLAQHTGKHVGSYMAIILNNEVISCPVIRSRIGRSGQIEGFNAEEAKQLEMLLNAGRIPVPLEVIQERTVSPTLGEESIRLSFRAGIIGFCLVLLFMLFYYRLPGLIADLALVMYAVFFIGALSMLNATLTLPGIAGIILSVGMAVDANVIIFERLKEELRAGKTVTTAVKDAFKRAWTAILDANVTTLITGFILWSVGSGPIKGFAVTLCLGILLSMFTAMYVTRNLLEAVATMPSAQKRWLLSSGRGVK